MKKLKELPLGIKRIKIENLLSFKLIEIEEFSTITCTLGKNNSGKSNLFKLISFFYKALEGGRYISPELNSNYNAVGTVEITYDTAHINKVVHSGRNSSNNFFQKVAEALFPKVDKRSFLLGDEIEEKNNELSLTLYIKNDGTYYFSNENRRFKKALLDIFPLFEIDARHLNLHNWNEMWSFLGKLRPFNAVDFQNELKEMIGVKSSLESYKKNLEEVNAFSNTINYSYRDKIVNFLKVGLKGDKFEFDGYELAQTSDGTNSFNHILTVCRLVSYLSKKTYQTPIIYIDEPELGLHPKKNEELIYEIAGILGGYYTTKEGEGYKKPPPKFIFSTHSQNIVKQVIKSFSHNHRIFHFSKNKSGLTDVSSARSNYSDWNFLCNFSDNEARLFFSSFILFVEGKTEKELFENHSLISKFPHLIGVDVYHAPDERVSKKITPEFINTAVPYYFLFDADKGVSFIKESDGDYYIKYKNYGTTLDLRESKIERQRSKSFLGFSEKSKSLNFLASQVIGLKAQSLNISQLNLKVTRPKSLSPFYRDLNVLLADQKCIILSTTIEGALINFDSRVIFYSWLNEEKKVNVSQVIERINKSKYFDESALIQYFRVIFNGKSETLLKYSNFNSKKLNPLLNKHSKKILTLLENSTIKHSKLQKTDGWVTSFLIYAIDFIEKESIDNNSNFTKTFSNYFKELYGIIAKLRYGS